MVRERMGGLVGVEAGEEWGSGEADCAGSCGSL